MQDETQAGSELSDVLGGWVAIELATPAPGLRVLVWTKNDEYLGAFANPKWFGGFSQFKDRGTCITGVTHWMPLPTVDAQLRP